jgi:hypothetical protein
VCNLIAIGGIQKLSFVLVPNNVSSSFCRLTVLSVRLKITLDVSSASGCVNKVSE